MPAGAVKLIFDIEGAESRLLHEHVLLCQAEAADVEARAVGGGHGDDSGTSRVKPIYYN